MAYMVHEAPAAAVHTISDINSKNSLTALPPWAQRAREIEAILKSDELNGKVIEGIEKTEEGYLIHTDKGDLRALIHYTPQQKQIGPPAFEFEFIAS